MRPALIAEQAETLATAQAEVDRMSVLPTVALVVRCHRCGEVVGRVLVYLGLGTFFQGSDRDADAPAIRPRLASEHRNWRRRYYYAALDHPSASSLPAELPLFCGRHDTALLVNDLRLALAKRANTIRI